MNKPANRLRMEAEAFIRSGKNYLIQATGDSYEGLTVAFDVMEGEFFDMDQAVLISVLLEKDEVASAAFKRDDGEYLELIFAQKELV